MTGRDDNNEDDLARSRDVLRGVFKTIPAMNSVLDVAGGIGRVTR